MKKKLAAMKEFIQNNSDSFSQEVMALRKRKGYNKTAFCAKTLLSETTDDGIKHGLGTGCQDQKP